MFIASKVGSFASQMTEIQKEFNFTSTVGKYGRLVGFEGFSLKSIIVIFILHPCAVCVFLLLVLFCCQM